MKRCHRQRNFNIPGKNALYPVYQNTDVTYYDQASKGLEAQLSDLSKARKFIFMEYHAIEDKESWHRIQKVLTERVQAGVEVRVFYDDMGSIFFHRQGFLGKDGEAWHQMQGVQPGCTCL